MNYSEELEFIKTRMSEAFAEYGAIDMHTAQKSAFDLVTDIDINIEKRLTAALHAQYPADRIHGEEFSSNEAVSGRTWTIDPIDGTCNMAHGSKLYGMQCSLIDCGEIVLGVVYLPHLGEWIYASKGSGCYCNGKKITVDGGTEINNAIVSFGDYPHGKDDFFGKLEHTAIARLYPRIAKIRMFGAACMDFAFVAQGRTHGTVVITKNLWDIAPGIIICREAGATVTNLRGLPYELGDDGVVAAANADISALVAACAAQPYKIDVDGIMRSFDACIFDFDGVVADTEKYHYLSWVEAFGSVGFALSPQDYAPLKSTGRPNIIAFAENKLGKKFTAKQRSDIEKIKDETFARGIKDIDESDMIKGAKEFLTALNGKYVKTGVGSSARTTNRIMDKLGLDRLFQATVDGTAELPKKPAPDVFVAVAEKLDVDPKRCLVFEDAQAGIDAALAMGAQVIAVGGIRDSRALLCINDFTELL